MTAVSREEIEDIDRRLRRALTSFFLRRTGNRAEADDLTQEVFLRVARHPDDGSRLRDAYVFRIAANLLADKARRNAVRSNYRATLTLDDYAAIDTLDPFRVTAGREELALLAAKLAGLPEKTRRIFTLYRIEGLDKRSIADGFGLSVRMVEIHVQRALVLLSTPEALR